MVPEVSLFLCAGSDPIWPSLLSRRCRSVGPLCHGLSWLSGADCASSICTVSRRLGNLSASDRAIDVELALTYHIWSIDYRAQMKASEINSPRLRKSCQDWTSSVLLSHPAPPPLDASPLHGGDKRPTDGAAWGAPGGLTGTGALGSLQPRLCHMQPQDVASPLASAGPPVRPTLP